MEKKEIYFLPLYGRISTIVIGIITICLIYYSINLNTNDSKFILLPMFIVLFLASLFFIEITFVKYIFKDDVIIVKFPFLKERMCYFCNIIGFALLSVKMESSLTIYTKDDKITIKAEGKKLKQKINEFMNNNYNIIKDRNIKEMEECGIEYFDTRIRRIMFYKDRMEVYEKDVKINTYYFEKDIKNAENFNSQILTLCTTDNNKIGITIYKSKGRIGLFEYIMDKYK